MARRLGTALMLWCTLAGCGGGGGGGADGGSLEDALRAASEGPIELRIVHGRIRDLRGRFSTTGVNAEERARDFVARFAVGFGLSDPAAELSLARNVADGDHALAAFGRVTAGVPLDGAMIQVHLEGDRIVLVTAQLPADGQLAQTQPSIDEGDAVTTLAGHLGVTEFPRKPAVALVAHDPGLASGSPAPTVLAYRLLATSPDGARIGAYVDARSGDVLSAEDWSLTAQNRWVARYDPALASSCKVQPCTAPDVLEVAHTVVFTESGPAVSDATADETAVYGALAEVHEYWSSTFGRDSYDGMGSKLSAFVGHPASPPGGIGGEQHAAVWKGDLQALFVRGSLVAPDIVAHEVVHGVIGSVDSGVLVEPECTPEELAGATSAGSDECVRERAPLRNQPGQSGALNEAVSDVFAVFTRQLASGDAKDWQISDKLGVLRDVAFTLQSASTKDHIDRYVTTDSTHSNGLIVGLAIHLMTAGGAHPRLQGPEVVGIGRAKVQQILYRALTLYFAPLTDFTDARWKMLRACEDFISRGNEHGITHTDCGSVLNGFAAVGIGEWDTDRDTWVDSVDNCDQFNPDQLDADGDSVGDACDAPPVSSAPACPPSVTLDDGSVATLDSRYDATGVPVDATLVSSCDVTSDPGCLYGTTITCYYTAPGTSGAARMDVLVSPSSDAVPALSCTDAAEALRVRMATQQGFCNTDPERCVVASATHHAAIAYYPSAIGGTNGGAALIPSYQAAAIPHLPALAALARPCQ